MRSRWMWCLEGRDEELGTNGPGEPGIHPSPKGAKGGSPVCARLCEVGQWDNRIEAIGDGRGICQVQEAGAGG